MRNYCALLLPLLLVSVVGVQGKDADDLYISSLEMPCYPPLARQARVEGSATIAVELSADGSVKAAEAMKGHPLLKSAALANVRTWKFAAQQGSTFQGMQKTITFEYKIEGESGWRRCASRVSFDSFDKVSIFTVPAPVMTTDSSVKK